MYEKTIAAGIMAICPETGNFLMLKRNNDTEYPGHWNFPGGHFDQTDEFPKNTAIREFREETGYKGIFKISKMPLHINKTNYCVFYTYIAIMPEEFTPNLKGEYIIGSESVNYGWFPLTYEFKSNEKIIPSIITIFDLERDTLKKIVNKFKDKNYE